MGDDLYGRNADPHEPVRVAKGEYEQHTERYAYPTGVYDVIAGCYHNLTLELYYGTTD